MRTKPEFIAMLAKKDANVESIPEIIDACRGIPVSSWGFKSTGLSDEDILGISKCLNEAGKQVYVEVVTYTQEEYFRIAELAKSGLIYCVTGTIYDSAMHSKLKECGVKYIPIVGKTIGLNGVITKPLEDIVADAVRVCAEDTDGISIMAYRHLQLDGNEIIKAVRSAIPEQSKLMVVGSVNSFERIDNVIALGADFFSIGSALFNAQFVPDADFRSNLSEVADYLSGWEADE